MVMINYESTDESWNDSYNPFHQSAEMVLNHLGMNISYHDISQGLPSKEAMEGIYAIISYHESDNMPQATAYCHWLLDQIATEKKLIIWNNLGAFKDSITKEVTDLKLIQEIYTSLGVKYGTSWTDNPFVIEVVYKDPDMMDFERIIDNDIANYSHLNSIDSDNKIYLKIKRSDLLNSESDVIIKSSKGGIISDDLGMMIDLRSNKKQWYLNPFKFFSEALGIEKAPRYDTTTLFGNRIFYSHIDGDGVRNVSAIEKYKQAYSSEIILKEILEIYPLPVSTSFIVADISPLYFGNKDLMKIARDIAKLENIEIGAHGFSHPLDWDNKITYFAIHNYSKKYGDPSELKLNSESEYKSAAIATVDYKTFIEKETIEAVQYLQQNIMPENKKASINMWTGNCRPPAMAIDLIKENNISAINGGDSRFDIFFPSYTAIAPLFRQVDGSHQVYASSCNENIYTNGWKGPFDGFEHVIQTYEQSEKPKLFNSDYRRVLPLNIYYHFFIADRKEGLRSLKKVYDYAMKKEITPIFTSDYCKIALSFIDAKIEPIHEDGWKFKDYKECRTIRFDFKLFPDLEKSENIIGYSHWHNCTYIYLNEAEEAQLYISSEKPSQIYLHKANAKIKEYRIKEDRISFQINAFKDSQYIFNNVPDDKLYKVAAFDMKGNLIYENDPKPSENNSLIINLSLQGLYNIEIKPL